MDIYAWSGPPGHAEVIFHVADKSPSDLVAERLSIVSYRYSVEYSVIKTRQLERSGTLHCVLMEKGSNSFAES